MGSPLPGESFFPIEFTRMSNIFGYELYSVYSYVPRDIGEAESGHKVEMGDCIKVKKHGVAYSIGANPCLIVVAIARERTPYLLHTNGEALDHVQIETIEKAVGGIAGGGPEMIREYADLLNKHGIKIIRSYDPEADFNVAVVRRKISDIPQGIHYSYNKTNIPKE